VMRWPTPPCPPGYEMPGIGYILLIGGLILGFIGIALCGMIRELLASERNHGENLSLQKSVGTKVEDDNRMDRTQTQH
jgi:hypothetical protein